MRISANTVLASFLEKLMNGKVPLEVVVRGKDGEENAKQIEQCIETVKKAGVSAKNMSNTFAEG
jgi:hypothetical protein